MEDNLKVSSPPYGQAGAGRVDRNHEVLVRPKERQETQEVVPPPAADSVQLSSQARELSKVKEVIAQSEADFRREKVVALQAQIAEGQYRVEGEALANSLLQSFLQESPPSNTA
ncbi:MAG: flagellar biosynthesis anti-sigma factor FlgM [Candidatus Tectomicrobia bacterium]|uniref:Negative regulator of flagellin synthesis n=1 Tax=Tectimicrobiota bacterium TaxID=2528274 RepID=A0A932CQR8_UNCTE|nr:flagellar biosynthesis anti-sigma factor FlgM [Candidatus Tectomicrobia bacterium]